MCRARASTRIVPWLIPAVLTVVLAVAAACGDGEETGATPAVTPGWQEPDPAQTASPPAPPAADAMPVEGAYELVQALPSATFDLMLGFATIPGSDSEGFVLTQDGMIWRVSLEDGSPPELFGDLTTPTWFTRNGKIFVG